MYIHFTDLKGAEAIVASKTLKSCSYIMNVYAVSIEYGYYIPGVQRPWSGRPANRDYAVLFTTNYPVDILYLEEAIWKRSELPLIEAVIVPADEAIKLLPTLVFLKKIIHQWKSIIRTIVTLIK